MKAPLTTPLAFLAAAAIVLSCTATSRSAEETPRSKYQVAVQRNVPVPMRDGVHLATDVYYPVENGLSSKSFPPC